MQVQASLRELSGCLLFGAHLERISLAEMSDEDLRPTCIADIVVSPRGSALVQQRTELLLKEDWKKMSLKTVFGSYAPELHKYSIDIRLWTKENNTEVRDKWLIVQCLGAREARKLALDHRAKGWLPFGAVAAHLSHDTQPIPSVSGHILSLSQLASCKTNLPVHISGCFDLAPLKRAVEFDATRTADSSGMDEGTLRAVWNRALLGCVLEAYAHLLQLLPSLLAAEQRRSMYSLWPSSARTDGSLEGLAICDALIRPLYGRMAASTTFLTERNQLLKITEGFFLTTELKPDVTNFVNRRLPIFMMPAWIAAEFKSASVSEIQVRPVRCSRGPSQRGACLPESQLGCAFTVAVWCFCSAGSHAAPAAPVPCIKCAAACGCIRSKCRQRQRNIGNQR